MGAAESIVMAGIGYYDVTIVDFGDVCGSKNSLFQFVDVCPIFRGDGDAGNIGQNVLSYNAVNGLFVNFITYHYDRLLAGEILYF